MSNTPPSPPFLSRIWPTLLTVLAALGLPTAAIAYFLTKYPLLAFIIFLLYELGVFIIGFLGKVWGKLEDPLAEHIALRLKQWAILFFSLYHRQYYQYLYYQHRDFDVRGLSTTGTFALELDQVFVELRVDPSTPQSAIVSPVQISQALLEGSHAIWDYLTSVSLRQHHLVIIGPPGSGKTTLLKNIVLSLIHHHRFFRRQQYHGLHNNLPILLFLRDHIQTIHENEQYSLINAICDHLSKWDQPVPPEGWFERQLSKGHCLVMLDGLDEVADPETRQQIVRWVERQMARWNQCRFLMTSRPFGYRSNPLQNVTVLEVRAFTFEQVERFVQQWYLANEMMSKQKDDPGVRMRAKSEAKALLQRLRTTPALFELTVNPLLLTMIATVHRYGGELPGNRVALYAEICEVFLGKRQQARGQVLKFTSKKIQSVLEPLAYHMILNGIRYISRDDAHLVIEELLKLVDRRAAPEAFLHMVENISGLLLEHENGVYYFAHLTFQEYLAAAYIKEKRLGQTLAAQVKDPWWRETILLYCAMEDATPIIAACLDNENQTAAAIQLAIDCDKEAQKVQPEVQVKLETLLLEGMEDPDPERQHIIAEALLAKRLNEMIHLKDETYMDTSLITCAEYQIFLDQQQSLGHYFHPNHWSLYRFATTWGSQPILGICPSAAKAFCNWLTERETGPWRYRLPMLSELDRESPILSNLPSRIGFWLSDTDKFFWTKNPMLITETIVNEEEAQFSSFLDTIDFDYTTETSFRYPNRGYKLAINFANSLILNSALSGNTHNLANELARLFDLLYKITNIRFVDLIHKRRPFYFKVFEIYLSSPSLMRIRRFNSEIYYFKRNIDRIHNIVRIRKDNISLALNLDLVNNLIFPIVGDHSNGTTSEIVNKLIHDYAKAQRDDRDVTLLRGLTYIRIQRRTFNKVYELTNELSYSLTKALTSISMKANTIDLAINLCRALIVSIALEQCLNQSSLSRKRKTSWDQSQLSDFIDIYFGLIMLKKRIEGDLPACEGILIMKEKL